MTIEGLDHHTDQFPGPHLAMVTASIRAGNTPSQLWTVPQPGAPPLLVLWDGGNRVFYLAGDLSAASALAELRNIVTAHLNSLRHGDAEPYFKVRALSPSLEEILSDIFPSVTLQPIQTLFMILDTKRLVTPAPARAPGVALLPITPSVLGTAGPQDHEYVLEEICSMWPSEQRFYAAGFGVVAVARDTIVCWCTAEYMSSTQCGIGIATHPDFRRRGVATAVAASFVQEAQRRDIMPCWECRQDNLPSVRVAEKTGFVPSAEETYWIPSSFA